MKLRSRAACAILFSLVGALNPPAFAQDSDAGATKMTDDALLVAQPCFEAVASDDYDRQYKDCMAASDKLYGVQHPGMTFHEVNVYNAMKASVLTAVGAAQAKRRGSRTEESCMTMEKAWNYGNLIDVSRSPSRGQEMWQIRQQTLAAVRECRKDFGMPPGESVLPAS